MTDRDHVDLELEAYRTALATRNFEISLFWQRSNYFLVLSTAIAVGFFARGEVTVEGRNETFSRPSDSGFPVAFHFCPQCGATVYYVPDAIPGMVSVPVGAFADPGFPPPRVSVYGDRRHAWVRLPDDIEQFD